MIIKIPELSVVALMGASGSGKSTFAAKHFLPTEVLSSDFFRGLVSDDTNSQEASGDAFDVLNYVASKRLARGKLVVVDATNVQKEARKELVELARKNHVIPVVIILDIPERTCQDRNKDRPDRDFGSHVVRGHCRQLKRSLRTLKREGFRHVFKLDSQEAVDAAEVVRVPLWNNKKDEHGPFDIVGDVHGCGDELVELLGLLGYEVTGGETPGASHPDGRKVVFVGDLVDRGPRIVEVLRLAMSMVKAGTALCVPGNHDIKLLRKLRGKNVQLTHGLADSVQQLEAESDEFREEVTVFLDDLVSHYVLDDGKLVVAHAGMKEEYQGRGSGIVRQFALYGETTGETDEFGLPIRYPWAEDYRGTSMVVYGHTPVPEPEWLNRTVNIDTGCVFGGSLTALRYPEKEFVSVPAARTYAEPVRPILKAGDERSAQHSADDVLDIADVFGKRIVNTPLRGNITIRAEQSTAALEVMSRFAINPKWLVYLPPTMSPCETSNADGWLERPEDAFGYFRRHDAGSAVCEEKHMGSRAIVVVCRNDAAAAERFGVVDESPGACYTRTGRPFFRDAALQDQLLDEVRQGLDASDFWARFETEWVCLDAELMPWSEKAQELLTRQYAAVGAAAGLATSHALASLKAAEDRGADVGVLRRDMEQRTAMVSDYVNAYRQYCWPVDGIADYRLAPFHILATEGCVHADKDHAWHMSEIERICQSGSDVLLATRTITVDLDSDDACRAAIDWWEQMTETGGEGMVVKPLSFIHRDKHGLVQPAVKCRGREYLRIIYGPEYTRDEHLERLRNRGLNTKRSLAIREFALGLEALERFVRREPLRRVHECVFGVLALESEPVDPRL